MTLAATVQWDVRTTGNDTNGGGFDPGVASPGTDYSLQNSPQVTFTDLVIGATTTQLTSALNPFSSTSPGNIINITGGAGFTTGRYEVLSVSGSTATMDRSVGTGGSTNGTGNLGGAFTTISAANTAAVAKNTINIKNGTYTLTSAIAVSTGNLNFIGYNSTHNDGGTAPLITTATNTTNLFTNANTSGVISWINLSLSNTAGTRASGIVQLTAHGTTELWVVQNCTLDGFTTGINSDNVGSDFDVSFIIVHGCEIKNCTSWGINSNAGTMLVAACYLHGNAQDISTTSAHLFCTIYRTICSSQTSSLSSQGALVLSSLRVYVRNCTLYNCAGNGFDGSGNNVWVEITNTLFYGCQWGIRSASGTPLVWTEASGYNAFGNNTNPNVNWTNAATDVTLTANPFTSAGTGDFSLNGTAGGGAACIGAGWPGTFPGGTSVSHLDIGAVQSGTTVTNIVANSGFVI